MGSHGNGKSLPDELRQLAELRDAGVLDEDEFKTAKQRLLDRQ
jgi:putative oligomerization/nucleic acid binding protein